MHTVQLLQEFFLSCQSKKMLLLMCQIICKQLLDEVFVISRIIKVKVRVISRDFDYSGYHKNRI